MATMKQGHPQKGVVVNRIPPSSTKRGSATAGLLCQNSSSISSSSSATKPHDAKRQKMEWEPEAFPKLNPVNDASHAKRIETRAKAIAKGKNTAGYDAYVQSVPKHKRRRSMDTPSTPDHTLDIPAKRWQGLVKAWRVALHKYDPPDLVTNASAAATATEELNEQASAVATTPSKGSDFGASSSPAFEDTTPISMGSPHGQRSPLNYSRNLDFDEGEDSDDDLL